MALRAASPTARMTSARSRTSPRVSRTDVNVPSVNTHSTAIQFLTLCFVFHHIKTYINNVIIQCGTTCMAQLMQKALMDSDGREKK